MCIYLGALTWLLMTTALTWIMIPGVGEGFLTHSTNMSILQYQIFKFHEKIKNIFPGFFYNGMARSKSSLSLLMLCLWSCAVVSIQVRVHLNNSA